MALYAGCYAGAARNCNLDDAEHRPGPAHRVASHDRGQPAPRHHRRPGRSGPARAGRALRRRAGHLQRLRQHRHPARGDRRRDRCRQPVGRRLGGLQHRTEHRRGHAMRLHAPASLPGRQERDDRCADADRRAPNAAAARHGCRRRDRGQRAVQRPGARAAQRRQRRRRRAAGGGLPGQGLPWQGQEASRRLRAAPESHRLLRQGRDHPRDAEGRRRPAGQRRPTCGSSCARPGSARSTSIAAA